MLGNSALETPGRRQRESPRSRSYVRSGRRSAQCRRHSSPSWRVDRPSDGLPGQSIATIRQNTDALFGPGATVEFAATFGADPFQHVGFATDLIAAPFAIFSTGNQTLPAGLYARSASPDGTSVDTPITGVSATVPHVYRIEWKPTEIVYYIDGQEVARHPVAITANMRPIASDSTLGGAKLSVDWLHLSPYAASATFLSRVFDAGASALWGQASWTADTPAGTTLGVSARTGNTPTPDATWSTFALLTNGGNVGTSGRYAQYQAQFSSSTGTATPSLNDISLSRS